MSETEIMLEERRHDIAKLFLLRPQRGLSVHLAPSYLDLIVQFRDSPDIKFGVEIKPYNTRANSQEIQSFLKNLRFSLTVRQFYYRVVLMFIDEVKEKAKIGLVTPLDKKNKLEVVEAPALQEANKDTINEILDKIIKWYKGSSVSSKNGPGLIA